ncbi:hypothetical protein [Hyphomonas sp.]|uniref:hypothetical protein n=1 Tax=Hyphomonas sp. TaxID=87 RepID=UPI001BD0FE8E|nr:hypothetical protein [Hyphomonas sp.]
MKSSPLSPPAIRPCIRRRLIGQKPRSVLASGPASDAPSAHINAVNRRIVSVVQADAQGATRLLDPG